MSKFKLTFADKKILEFKEVPEDDKRDFYSEATTFDEFISLIKENKIQINPDHKIAVRHSEDGMLKEIFAVVKDNPLPRQYFFESLEQAQSFSDQQGLEESVHLRPQSERDLVKKFFSDEPCDFVGYKSMHKAYKREIEDSGGESCTQCARNRIMKKYQALVLDAVSPKPSNVHSLSEKK